MAAAWARAGAVALAVLGADQVTKALVEAGVARGERNGVLPGVELVHVRNEGIAFGLFDGHGAVLSGVTLGALALLVGYFALRSTRSLLWLATGLLVGGALGNLVDRARQGAVTDFVDLPLWPAFNLADVAITAGVLTLLASLERPRDRDQGA